MASVQLNGTSTGTPASAAPFLTDAMKLINSVKTFIFDCDGVIWKGDKLIDGVPETLDMLHAMGKRLVFVTNNSTKSRKQYAKKFDSLGLNVAEEEIFPSSFAAAAYLKSVNFPSNKKVEFNWSSHKLASVILEALYSFFSFFRPQISLLLPES
jgi:phosphoglycolate phosphatase